MKIIQDTFGLVLKFHKQLISAGWHNGAEGVKTHRNYAHMKHTYKAFHSHSVFLYKGRCEVKLRSFLDIMMYLFSKKIE